VDHSTDPNLLLVNEPEVASNLLSTEERQDTPGNP